MKHIKKLLALALVAITILAVAVPAMAAYSTMYVSVRPGETVRLRNAPNTKATVLVNIPHGTAVSADYYNSNWFRVKYQQYTGYMMSKFITSNDPNGGIQPPPNPSAHPQTLGQAFGVGTFSYNLKYYYEVKNIQLCLSRAGYYSGAIDGRFGQNTDTAVYNYQLDHDLAPDGIVGGNTKMKLWESYKGVLMQEGYLR